MQTLPIAAPMDRNAYLKRARRTGQGLLHSVIARDPGVAIATIRLTSTSVHTRSAEETVLTALSNGILHLCHPEEGGTVCCVGLGLDEGWEDAVGRCLREHEIRYRIAEE